MTDLDVALDDERQPGAEAVDSTSRAYSEVRAAILDGTLAPGQWVSRVRLAAELKLSRTPLREALRLLENEGLVETVLNRRLRIPPLSIADLEALYALRIAAEPLAVRVSVPQLDGPELEAIEKAKADLDGATTNFATYHRRFHFGLFQHAAPRVRRHVEDLWDHAERYRLLYQRGAQAALRELSAREHDAILEAARARDGELCGRLVAEHLARTALTVIVQVDGARDPRIVRESLRYVLEAAPPAP
ncbi:MAG TPA: GntR family transcriptional regulator [Baekduia sp.]|nr:GntR family transcriptional regulator [Baekduia sp.]